MGNSTTTATLPPMIVPRGQPARGVSLQQPAVPAPGSSVVLGSGARSEFEQYPTMLWLLTASGVLDEIGARPVTIIAPSEAAFRDFAVTDGNGMLSNPTAFAPVLRRHVVLGVYDAEQLVAAGSVTNLAGERLSVWANGRLVLVNEVTLLPPATDGAHDETMAVFGADRLLLLPEGTG
jgi:hypothetical protein